jgi:hypothetical protein
MIVDDSFDSLTDKRIDENCEWSHILQTVNYHNNYEIVITSKEIKDAKKSWKGSKESQFEPRLLCKQDSEEDRPTIFKKYGLYILSIRNGDYLLTKMNIYQNLIYDESIPTLSIQKKSNILLLQIGNSESSIIDNIRYSGLFESQYYLNEPIMGDKLLSGRHRCSFTTRIGEKEIHISGSQYETDASYESENKILLIECKNGKRLNTFNIRQLYYPYRVIYDLIKEEKEIIPLFIYYDKQEIIHIWKYRFENPFVFTSIQLVNYSKYTFRS